MCAAPGQHHRHPGVKSSPCRCKRMGWRFRRGNSSGEFGTAGNTGPVSVPAAWEGTGTVTGTAVPCVQPGWLCQLSRRELWQEGECWQVTLDGRAVLQGPRGCHCWGQGGAECPGLLILLRGNSLFAPQPTPKPNPAPHGREGVDAQLRKPCLAMVWPLHRLTLPGKSCFIPLAGACHGIDSSACLLCFERS